MGGDRLLACPCFLWNPAFSMENIVQLIQVTILKDI